MTERLTKTEMLAQMAHLFFAYHDIILTCFMKNRDGCIIKSKTIIPTEIREKFQDKFEFKDMKINYVKHDKMTKEVIYAWERPKSDMEKKLELWVNSGCAVVETEPIMFIPDTPDTEEKGDYCDLECIHYYCDYRTCYDDDGCPYDEDISRCRLGRSEFEEHKVCKCYEERI